MSLSQAPWASKCAKPTLKAFKETRFTSEEMEEYSRDAEWWILKAILTHRDCPDYVALKATKSPVWYERLVAFLAKPNREKMWKFGLDDIKSTVRAAVYKTALIEQLCPYSEITSRILNDKWVKGYFGSGYSFWSIDRIQALHSGDLSFKDWLEHNDYVEKASSEA